MYILQFTSRDFKHVTREWEKCQHGDENQEVNLYTEEKKTYLNDEIRLLVNDDFDGYNRKIINIYCLHLTLERSREKENCEPERKVIVKQILFELKE